MEPLYIDALGLGSVLTGLIYAGFTIPFLVVSTFIGGYIDRRGAKGIIIAGIFLIALSTLGFGLTTRPMLLFILSLITGVGDALLLPAVMSVIDTLSSYHTKERISGVKVFAESAGYFVGPLAAGAVTALLGFSEAFVALGIFLIVITAVTIVMPFRVKQP